MQRTTEWQRVDNTGCVQTVVTGFLLAWVAMIPYALMFHRAGWLLWSSLCVLAGSGLLVRERKRKRARPLPGVSVEVWPESVRAGESIAVRLVLSGEVATRVRWWKAALLARVEEEETVSASEFAVDPEAEAEPVADLEMLLPVPRVDDAREWWVVVTVETERGRMESGKVAISVVA
jgi:hypothetical protein